MEEKLKSLGWNGWNHTPDVKEYEMYEDKYCYNISMDTFYIERYATVKPEIVGVGEDGFNKVIEEINSIKERVKKAQHDTIKIIKEAGFVELEDGYYKEVKTDAHGFYNIKNPFKEFEKYMVYVNSILLLNINSVLLNISIKDCDRTDEEKINKTRRIKIPKENLIIWDKPLKLKGWGFIGLDENKLCFFNGKFRGIARSKRSHGYYYKPITRIQNDSLYRFRRFSEDIDERGQIDAVFDLDGNLVHKSEYQIIEKEGDFWKVQTYQDNCRIHYAIVNDKDEIMQKWTEED